MHYENSTLTLPYVIDRLETDLLEDPNDWESRQTVDFGSADVECHDIDPFWRQFYKIEFHIWESEHVGCTNVQNACAVFQGDSTATHGNNHPHYSSSRINLTAADIFLGIPHRAPLVNHEVGHPLGLRDATPSQAVNQDAKTCRIKIRVNPDVVAPVWSIMHRGSCYQIPLRNPVSGPTLYDLIAFDENVADY